MWKSIGKFLANLGKYSLKGAKWASDHPEVIAAVATATGHSGAAKAVIVVGQAVEEVRK